MLFLPKYQTFTVFYNNVDKKISKNPFLKNKIIFKRVMKLNRKTLNSKAKDDSGFTRRALCLSLV